MQNPGSVMLLLVSMVIILPLIAFWAWMFRDMMNNKSLSADERSNWLWVFVLLNVFGAAFYYSTQFTQRK